LYREVKGKLQQGSNWRRTKEDTQQRVPTKTICQKGSKVTRMVQTCIWGLWKSWSCTHPPFTIM